MIRYSSYNRSYIILTERFNAFIYYTTRSKVPLTSLNYGRGRKHWLEYLGTFSPRQLRVEYPELNITYLIDESVPKILVGKVRELECMYIED